MLIAPWTPDTFQAAPAEVRASRPRGRRDQRREVRVALAQARVAGHDDRYRCLGGRPMLRHAIKVVIFTILALAVAIGVGIGVGYLFWWYHAPPPQQTTSPGSEQRTKS